MRWIRLPITRKRGYLKLLKHDMGYAHFAAWIALLQEAAQCRVRGVLADSDGNPLSLDDLSITTCIPVDILRDAVLRLSQDVGWIELIEKTADSGRSSADTGRSSASTGLHNITRQDKTGQDNAVAAAPDASVWAEEFCKEYPLKVADPRRIENILFDQLSSGDLEQNWEVLKRNLASWKKYKWADTPAKFIPTPQNWLARGDWAVDPTPPQPHDNIGSGNPYLEEMRRNGEIAG